MNQKQLKEQFLQYAENNLNNETILQAITVLLDNISNGLYQDGYIKESNTLNTCLLNIKEILKDNDNIRICDNCHKIMSQGYCIDDGLEYYCSDVCLNTKYSEEEFNGMYSQGYAYYTTWED